ncbi:uncharacterized protein LOC117505412 [Thalassophryne amazonica]|uniref:uncharacterized protein LOC117505412 n=1 Tax=Thalassophryne amazonica TaxID=390379 RepID=UPI001471CF83|nr:uncharacterized protein LOC117505412 [Thalassophryne amazonica]
MAQTHKFLCLFSAKMTDGNYVRQENRFLLANIGGNAYLPCFCKLDSAVMFYWYKQPLGQKPRLIATYYKHDNKPTLCNEFKDDKRFTVEIKDNIYSLNISDLEVSDSATYYCSGYLSHDFEFAEGTILSVKGSGLDILASVQQPPSETIQPGRSVTLTCTVQPGTCEKIHMVYWFKNTEDHQSKILYVHGGRNNNCEHSAGIQSQTCVYNFQMRSVNASDDGTYYCAVLACGYIVFGNGTNLGSEPKYTGWHLQNLLTFLGVALAYTAILVITLALLMFKMYRRNLLRQTESQATPPYSTPPLTTNAEGDQYASDLHYTTFMEYKGRRSRRQMDDSMCVYSSVRQ